MSTIPTRNRPAALVTGGRRGIGRGIAWALAAAGFDVAINDLAEDDAVRETLDGLAVRKSHAVFLPGDISDLDGQEALIERAWQAFGGLDCLVNNAGVTSDARGDLLELTEKSYDRVMAINLRGPFFLTQRFARRLIATPPEGFARTIISVASINAVLPSAERGDYCLSKTGVSMMTKLFAQRLAEHGITVHEIRPGVIRTDMTAPVRDKYEARIAAGLSPIKRWGEPADIGRAVAALASGAFAFSTGDAYHVDGGLHMGTAVMDLLLDRVASPIGTICLVSDGTALCALVFEEYEDWLTRHLAQHYAGDTVTPTRDPGGFSRRLTDYFDGDLATIETIPVALRGSDFQRAVWAALREIPLGTTTTYGALAKQLGKPPGASRAVGLANGANPVSIVVPCHRVIGANAKLVGYGGGLPRKQWLLAHERVELKLAV